MLNGQRCSYGSNILGLAWGDPGAYPAALDYVMSSTTTYKLGLGFIVQEDAVPDTAYVYLTLDNYADIQAELWTDDAVNNRPSAKLTNSNTVTVTTPTAGVVTFTGLAGTASASKEDRLWLVLSTPSGTPAGSIRVSAAKCLPYFILKGSPRSTYTTSWTTSTYAHVGLAVVYPSGYTDGMVVADITEIYSTSYGSNEAGVRFISPDTWLSISGVSPCIKRTGSASHTPNVRIRVNGAIFDSAALPSYARVLSAGATHIGFVFNPPVVIPPKSEVIITVIDSSGNASNYYRIGQIVTPSAIGSLAINNMRPMEGTWQGAYYNGSSWTFTDYYLPFITFTTTQNKGVLPSPINRRRFNAMR